MKTFTKSSIVLFAMLFVNYASAQFTRQQANDLVLNTILSDDVGKVDVYSAFNSKSTDISFVDNETITNPYSESWGFFVDDNPFADWYHSSRFIFVNTSNGEYTIEDKDIYPKFCKTEYEEISSANCPDQIVMDGTAFVPDPQKVESNYNYAET